MTNSFRPAFIVSLLTGWRSPANAANSVYLPVGDDFMRVLGRKSVWRLTQVI